MRLRRGQKPTRRLAHVRNEANCTACGACVVACTSTNQPEMMYRKEKGWDSVASNIRSIEGQNAQGRPTHLLNQCQHCEDAPCVHTCPFGAVYYNDDGLVAIDERLCIGCSYCVAACPYNVRWMHPDSGLPKKCMGNACLELVAADQKPACVQACPANARDFGDINDPSSTVSQTLKRLPNRVLLETAGTKPKYFIVESSS